MAVARKVQKNPDSEGARDIAASADKKAADALLNTSMPTEGGTVQGNDPRLEERGGTRATPERVTTPSDTNEPAEANQRRQSDDIDSAGA